jgi:Glycosyl hydrolase family 12
MLRIRGVFLAFAALALGTGSLAAVTAAGARADDAKLCGYQIAQVDGGRYTVQNNEWGSSASECVTTDGHAEFRVANSAISDPTDGAPGGYPSIFTGCHWGDCTTGGLATHPLLLAGLGPDKIASSWYTTQPNGSQNVYDVAYDIWINRTPATSGAPDGTEVMIWINHHGPVQPAGNLIATDVRIGAHHYDIWYTPGSGAGDGVSYEMMHPHIGVTDLDIGAVIYDAEQRGYTDPSWYLIAVEAGFEIWRAGAGLATRSFSVNSMGSTRLAVTGQPPAALGPRPPGPLSLVGVLGGEDLLAGRAERPELRRGQGVDEELADGGHVTGGGRHHLLPALLGEDGVDEAAVAAARLAADPAPGLEAADHVRQPGQRAAGQRGELAHPQGAVRGFRQAGQDQVVEVADARVLLQLRVERGGQLDEQGYEGAPGTLFLVA